MSNRLPRSALLALVAAVVACESGPPPVGSISSAVPAGLGGVVAEPVTIRVAVADGEGSPLEGYPVRFLPASGAGSTNPTEASSDASGTASTEWTLGTTAGGQSLTASAGGESVTIVVIARADAPASLAATAGAGQMSAVGETLSSAVVVRARDRFGNAVPDVEVGFRILAGGGTLAAPSGRTDAAGNVSPSWRLGPTLGEQSLNAEAPGLEPVRVNVTASAGPAARVTVFSGNSQSGRVARALANPLVAELRDRFGNLAANGRVEFRGDGSVSPSPATAGADGRATATWTMGNRAGTQSLRAVAGVSADSASFTATATPGQPSDVSRVGGHAQRGWSGGVLADSLVVKVVDEFDNPVPGVEVAFAVTGGGGTAEPATATTRATGEAKTAWRLGSGSGTHTLEARAGSASATFAATATSGPPATIELVSGDRQTAPILTALPTPLVVSVRDAASKPVEGARVELLVEDAGSVEPGSPITDSAGTASFRWTVGLRVAVQSMRVRSGMAQTLATATVTVGPPRFLVPEGDNQQAFTCSALPNPVAVIVTDAYANPIAGVQVSFVVTAGDGGLPRALSATHTTNTAGRAVAGWVMGQVPGTNRLRASAADLGVDFIALGTQSPFGPPPTNCFGR